MTPTSKISSIEIKKSSETPQVTKIQPINIEKGETNTSSTKSVKILVGDTNRLDDTKLEPISKIQPLDFDNQKWILQQGDNLKSSRVKKNKTIKFTKEYIEENLPGFTPFYYYESSDFLKSIDDFDSSNYKNELEKFKYVDGIQSSVSDFTTELIQLTLDHLTIKDLKSEINVDNNFLFFGIKRKVKTNIIEEYNKFNNLVKQSKDKIDSLLKSADDTHFRLKKSLSRYNYFKSLLGFIISEIKEREIITDEELNESLLLSRYGRFNVNDVIISQVKMSLDLFKSNCKLSIEDMDDYLNHLKPSLDLLLTQDRDKFVEQFTKFIKD